MFYDKFCSIVSCSVIKVIIDVPSCTGCSESIQVFNTSIICPLSLLCTRLMRSRSWICWWKLLFLISGIIFVALLCIFSILLMSCLKFWDQNCTACSTCGWTRDLYNGRISSLFLYLKLWIMNPSTLLAVLQLISVCFYHFRSLVMMIPRYRC